MTAERATPTYRPMRAMLLSILFASIGAGLANTLIAIVATVAGVQDAAFTGLLPASYLVLGVIGVIGGAIGWHLVNRFATRPTRVLRWLVPATLLVSFVPDVLVAAAISTPAGWVYGFTLALMHVATIGLAVVVYWRLMPLKDADEASTAIPA